MFIHVAQIMQDDDESSFVVTIWRGSGEGVTGLRVD